MRIELRELGHAYLPGRWLFRHLSYEFVPGHSYALTGASGSGKSTLMSILSGWTVAAEGDVEFEDVRSKSWVFQNPYGVARRTAADHVAFPFLAAGQSPKEADRRALDLLSEFRLSDVADRPFRQLSGGEAQRLMLARATAAAPSLLLVDEPTAQLDRATSRVVNEVIGEAVSDETILIIATHDEETRDACDLELNLTLYAPGPLG